jgi:hypothetical protein
MLEEHQLSTLNNQLLFSASRRLWLMGVERASTVNNQLSTAFLCFAAFMVEGR